MSRGAVRVNIEEMLAREEIRQRMSEYAFHNDNMDAENFAAVFAEDGIFEGPITSIRGRKAIEQWKKTNKVLQVNGKRPEYVRHNIGTQYIVVTGETAKATTYWTVLTDVGLDHTGYYEDDFVVEKGSWRIAHRRVRVKWLAENSCLNTKSASKADRNEAAGR
jgi:hypothetical protein